MSEKISLYLRTAVLGLMLGALAGVFLWLCYDNMLNPAKAIDPEESDAINTFYTSKIVQAARGDITDRYGRVLVTNKASYVVTLDLSAMGQPEDQAKVVQQLLALCSKHKVEWVDEEFPVSQSAPYSYIDLKTGEAKEPFDMYKVVGEDGKTSNTRLYRLMQRINEEKDTPNWGGVTTSADQLVKNMVRYFGIQRLEQAEQRTLLGVLYSAYLRGGEGNERILWTDYYFAKDVDIHFITDIKEAQLPGVDTESLSVRNYKTDSAAHLLGQVGAISAEKWEELNADPDTNTYHMNDSIGLSGVESAFEQYLRGVDGTQRTTYDDAGNVVGVSYPVQPQVGNNVALTLDIELQAAAEKALAEYTDALNNGEGGSAAVVLRADDSSILAMASYPTFQADKYNDNYKKLAKDKRLPLLNRALNGIYAPGSTFKMCTGTAAIDYGVATLNTEVKCTGVYHEHGLTQKCWYSAGHGYDNLSEAVRDSCNVYFYTMGWSLGIDHLNKIATDYGLAQPTGIELAESVGHLAGPEFAATIPGGIWYPGNVTSAAIGQSDNQFTVLQLANYIATFCRGGKRLDAHLLKNAKSSDNTAIVHQHKSKKMGEVELSSATQKAIATGMGQVIEADKITYFKDLEDSGVKVACKTGTAELGKTKRYNAVFVAFAPIDDPEIIVATVVEKSLTNGAESSNITADIMNFYFSESAALERTRAENQLVK